MKQKEPVLFEQAEHRWVGFAAYLLLAVFYCASIVYAYQAVNCLPYNFLQCMLGCGIFIVILYFLSSSEYIVISAAAVLVSAGGVITLMWFLSEEWQTRLFSIYLKIEYVAMLVTNAYADEAYNLHMFLFFCFVRALFVTLFMLRFYRFPILLLGGAAVFIIELFVGIFDAAGAFFIFTVCISIMFLIRPGRKLHKKRQGNKKLYGRYARAVFPLCLTAALLGTAVSSVFPKEPSLSVSTVNNMSFNSAGDVLELLFPGTVQRFNFNRTGFNPNPRRLGGDITIDHTKVMTVMSNSGITENLYLGGARQNVYNGRTWSSALKQTTTYEDSIYAKLDNPYPNYYDSYNLVQITPVAQSFKTLFVPANLNQIDAGEGRLLSVTQGGDMEASPAIQTGESYSFYPINEFFYFPYENADYWNYLISSYFDPDEIEDEELLSLYSPVFYEDMDYSGDIMESYGAVPDSVPERVYELAAEVTKDGQDNYEKLVLLEEYLRQFPYTLSPGEVPSGRDFVDYFLFDGQEGYCTYYASAMCIMARCIGIPSRFVQGYVVRYCDPGQEVTVTNAQAHAWPEFYLDENTWVPFEPTGTYAYSDVSEISVSPGMADNEDFVRHMEDLGFDTDMLDISSSDTNTSSGESSDSQLDSSHSNSSSEASSSASQGTAGSSSGNASSNGRGGGVLLIVIIIAAASGGIFLYYRFLINRRSRIVSRCRDTRHGKRLATTLYGEIEGMLALLSDTRQTGETPMAFADRIEEKYSALFSMRSCAQIYTDTVYGARQPLSTEKNYLVKSHRALEVHLKEVLRPDQYLLHYLIPFAHRRQSSAADMPQDN